ncbi:MAG TPA: endonuclease/exonuclease/phosphatase family protein [Phycisphaerae bacterium]|nr:endonuclease/exonuclease/phosphatase family protein [Phycisphaerae bacterium]HOJ76211.1 endonuclease/exonuclease/phosphatase family protein [Phycisphaerae bacterium]HOM53577.1 endonuclease/exonuclease/phosphatase family protein [Phycisphaerae bacterium]HON68866.1 endonuclease/exonuclease/phosphatase family protein [Phycisphaerae bacterium]HOQ84550.1 endonuclease/exonuclease/phosphatase family protein [Phycisphaerae bacterium]
MTYNIHIAKGLDGRLDIERTARVIREANPDLVAVQEVDRGAKRTEGMDQPARLAELTGMQVVFVRNLERDGGEYGNAVLSRLPIISYQHHLLPRFGKNEQRGVLEVHVECQGRPLVFLATHLDHQKDDAERLASVEMIREIVAKHRDKAVIVAGDFNAYPDTAVMGTVGQFLTLVRQADGQLPPTFPANHPKERLDYILHNGAFATVDSWVVPETVASDHRPVVADLKWAGKR